MPTRRAFIKSAGVAVAGGYVLSGTASATHFDEQPSHVNIHYDESVLKKYQPLLWMRWEDQQKFRNLYGWVATSPEFETDICVFWAEYTHQDGWLGNLDSHHGDHEPMAVEVDSDTGEVTRVRASVYHWLKGETTADTVPMDGSNPRLGVISPWHQYRAAKPDEICQRFAVEDLTAVYQDWLDAGLEKSLAPGASTNPWMMRRKSDWWRSTKAASAGLFDLSPSTKVRLVRVAQSAGIDETGSLEA